MASEPSHSALETRVRERLDKLKLSESSRSCEYAKAYAEDVSALVSALDYATDQILSLRKLGSLQKAG